MRAMRIHKSQSSVRRSRGIEAADGRQQLGAHHDVRATGRKRVPAGQQGNHGLRVGRRTAAQDPRAVRRRSRHQRTPSPRQPARRPSADG